MMGYYALPMRKATSPAAFILVAALGCLRSAGLKIVKGFRRQGRTQTRLLRCKGGGGAKDRRQDPRAFMGFRAVNRELRIKQSA